MGRRSINLNQSYIRQTQVDVEIIESKKKQVNMIKNKQNNKGCVAQNEPQPHTRSKQFQQVVGRRSINLNQSYIRQHQVDVEIIESKNKQNNTIKTNKKIKVV